MIHYDISPLIRCKPGKLIAEPQFVRLNEFSESATAQFRRDVEAALRTGQPIVPVVLDSYGGDGWAMMACVDVLDFARRHATIATIVEGKAMSAAAVLLTCGDKGYRYAAPSATVMIHDGSELAVGKSAEIQAVAKETSRIDHETYLLMDRNCGQKEGYFEALVHEHAHADWYLTAREAKRHGIVNHIGVPEMLVKVDVDFAFLAPRQRAVKKTKKRGGRS